MPALYPHLARDCATPWRQSSLPVVEVHISNIFARESFRQHSHIAPVAKASLCGFGVGGYALAIDGLAALIDARRGDR